MAARRKFSSVEGLNRMFRALPKEMSVELRDTSMDIANDIAGKAKSRAMGVSKTYATYVAPTIRARRDRVPVIAMGSRKRIRRGNARQVVGELIWGVEFGGGAYKTTRQFLPHLGQTGYAVWPTIRQELPDAMDRWADALFKASLDSARKGGGR